MSDPEQSKLARWESFARLLIMGALVGFVYDALIWILTWYRLAPSASNLIQNRSMRMRAAVFAFEHWAVWVFALGIFMLACIKYGAPRSWIEKMRPGRLEPHPEFAAIALERLTELRRSEREECLHKAAALLQNDYKKVLWPMNALFKASAPSLRKNEDVVWVCGELIGHGHEPPFGGLENHVPSSDWLEFLKCALVRPDLRTETSGDYLNLAQQWPKLKNYPEPLIQIPHRLWIKKEALDRQES